MIAPCSTGGPQVEKDVRKYAQECRNLMEEAYARFQCSGTDKDREEALLWMRRRDGALRSIVFQAGA